MVARLGSPNPPTALYLIITDAVSNAESTAKDGQAARGRAHITACVGSRCGHHAWGETDRDEYAGSVLEPVF